MQDYNTIIDTIQVRLNKCPTRSVMDRYKIGSGTPALIMSRYQASGIPVEELRCRQKKGFLFFAIISPLLSLFSLQSIYSTTIKPAKDISMWT